MTLLIRRSPLTKESSDDAVAESSVDESYAAACDVAGSDAVVMSYAVKSV